MISNLIIFIKFYGGKTNRKITSTMDVFCTDFNTNSTTVKQKNVLAYPLDNSFMTKRNLNLKITTEIVKLHPSITLHRERQREEGSFSRHSLYVEYVLDPFVDLSYLSHLTDAFFDVLHVLKQREPRGDRGSLRPRVSGAFFLLLQNQLSVLFSEPLRLFRLHLHNWFRFRVTFTFVYNSLKTRSVTSRCYVRRLSFEIILKVHGYKDYIVWCTLGSDRYYWR